MKPNRVVHTLARLTLRTALATALSASLISAPVLAQDEGDLPARVGRLALTQGQVSIASDVGAELMPAQVNWPVTSGNTISTAAGARTELRIGSTSIRLDGDSSLEILQLDDATLRVRLQYGSASVRVVNTAAVEGFELETPQARVGLAQPGRVRVDAERVRDTTAVTVFDGAALVDGGGSQLTVRAGKRAELGDDDVRTLTASRDAFDDWSLTRDRYDDNADRAPAARYVTNEMTGYEDLDRYGSWSQDPEYGALWSPSVDAGWVPYRDGSWTWVDPWGWTWVDNSPWGYAPFHYGRWVEVNRRWAWAPGRRSDHLVWAPALVGWVGGSNWNVAFGGRNGSRPAAGWYPLTPHDRFEPHYRAPQNHVRWLNEHVKNDPRRPRDYRPAGLTVVPQDRFGQPGQRGRVTVPRAPMASVGPGSAQPLPAGGPPAAPAWANRPRGQQAGIDRGPDRRPDRNAGRGPDRGPDRNVAGPGRIDAGRNEAGRIDAGRNDAGRNDAGRIDAGRNDAGRIDAGRNAGWRIDGGRVDMGRNDGGRGDNGRLDTGRVERDGLVRQRPGQAQGLLSQAAPGQVQPATPVQGQPVNSPTPHLPTQPLSTINSPTPRQSPQPLSIISPTPSTGLNNGLNNAQNNPGADNWRRDRADRGPDRGGDRGDRGGDRNDRREQPDAFRNRQPAQAMQPAPVMQAAQPARLPAAQPAEPMAQPARVDRQPMRVDRPQPQPAAVPAPAARPAAPAPAAVAREAPRQQTDGRGRDQRER